MPKIARIALFLSFLLTAHPIIAAESANADNSEGRSRLLSALLEIQGFNCDPPAGADGLTCVGTIDGYPREVAIVIPVAYHPRARADVILHLHGFNLDSHPLGYMLSHFQYAHGLAQSGRDAVLIVPSSMGQCDDFNLSLADTPAHFRAFIDHVMALLVDSQLASTADPATITLTGHSGAYYPLGAIIQNGVYPDRIHELYLLDATYGRAPDFAKYAEDPAHRFWSAYHTYDPNMEEVNPEIMGDLHQLGLPYYVAPGPDLTPQTVRTNRVGFVISDVDHDTTSTKYFAMFLAH